MDYSLLTPEEWLMHERHAQAYRKAEIKYLVWKLTRPFVMQAALELVIENES